MRDAHGEVAAKPPEGPRGRAEDAALTLTYYTPSKTISKIRI
jgi:hypothetical protein